MKLLIATQTVDKDDNILGFFHDWIEEFAKHAERVHVICLFEGKHELPENVRVHSLGKERGNTRWDYLRLFYTYVWRLRGEYDSVFVHMNQIYVILGGLLWRIWKKKIGLWYTHKQVTLSLRIATFLTNIVFTASEESFRIRSKKKKVVGHGINADLFSCSMGSLHDPIRILHMGRITPIKNCDTLITMVSVLGNAYGRKVHLTFAGAPVTNDDKNYLADLRIQVGELGLQSAVFFVGAPIFTDVPSVFCDADIVVNAAPTGGVDKAPLSAILSKRPVVVSNRAYQRIFGTYAHQCIAEYRDPDDFSQKIEGVITMHDRERMLTDLDNFVRRNYSLEKLVQTISHTL